MREFSEPDVTEAREVLIPEVDRIVAGLPRCQFSTKRFIEVLLEDPDADAAYEAALGTLGKEERLAKMALHGQVISVALRNNSALKFAGFVRDDPENTDPHSHSSWWRKENA
ncbi:MAG: hypothetical protein QF609_12705 [Gammaproteobacteria bacterium]|nr:hypothetical protein [Gammaproteobacteria bacterium]